MLELAKLGPPGSQPDNGSRCNFSFRSEPDKISHHAGCAQERSSFVDFHQSCKISNTNSNHSNHPPECLVEIYRRFFTLQSTGQGKSLQLLASLRAGQAAPPCSGEVATALPLRLCPTAGPQWQDFEQLLQALQAPTLTSFAVFCFEHSTHLTVDGAGEFVARL